MSERRSYIHHHRSLKHCRWSEDGLGKEVSELSKVDGFSGIEGDGASGATSTFLAPERLALGADCEGEK